MFNTMNSIKKQSVFKNSIYVFIKQISQLLLPFISLQYVSRVLGASNYGKTVWALAIIGYFSLFSMLGINTYAIREGSHKRNDIEEIKNFASQVFSFNVITTVCVFLLCILFVFVIPVAKDEKVLLLIYSLLLWVNLLTVDWLYSIYEDYLYITIRTLIIQVIFIFFIFLFVKNESDYIIYAIIYTLSQCLSCFYSLFHSRKFCKIVITTKIEYKKLLKPTILLFSNVLLISIYLNADIVMLGIMKTSREVGIYEIASKIYKTMKGILACVITVSIPRLSYYFGNNKKEDFNLLGKKILTVLMLLGFPLCTMIFCLSKEAILVVAGESYISGHIALKILCPAICFAEISNFYVMGVLVVSKQERTVLKCTLFSALINILLNLVAIPKFGIDGAATTTLLSEFCIMCMSIYFAKAYFTYKIDLRLVISIIIGCLFIIFSSNIINIYASDLFVRIAIKLCIGGLLYCAVQMVVNIKKIKEYGMLANIQNFCRKNDNEKGLM